MRQAAEGDFDVVAASVNRERWSSVILFDGIVCWIVCLMVLDVWAWDLCKDPLWVLWRRCPILSKKICLLKAPNPMHQEDILFCLACLVRSLIWTWVVIRHRRWAMETDRRNREQVRKPKTPESEDKPQQPYSKIYPWIPNCTHITMIIMIGVSLKYSTSM